MRWKVLVVVALLAAIAPAQFTRVATVTVQAATGAVTELVGGHG